MSSSLSLGGSQREKTDHSDSMAVHFSANLISTAFSRKGERVQVGSRRDTCLLLALFAFVLVLLSGAPILSSVSDALDGDHLEHLVNDGPESTYSTAERTPHPSITIEGNAQFASMAQANGWPGAGSTSNPYVIAGLEIDVEAIGGSCITIKDTDVFFQISDCLLTGATGADSYGDACGIRLINVQNGDLLDNILPGNRIGIALGAPEQFDAVVESRFILISGNDCSGSTKGIVLYGSSDNGIQENTCNDCGHGIEESQTFDVFTEQPVFSQRNVIQGNIIDNAEHYGISAMASEQTWIGDNVIRRVLGIGVNLQDVTDATLFHNVLLNNGENARVESTQGGNSIDSNLWSDYTGDDLNYDGIGDTPYTGITFDDQNPRIWLNGY
ncbi:hypothetical protein EU538_13130, partial [Candidatus Thorarchaeota archaeon]